MKFLCGSCRTKYQISDEKVRGKILTIRCKKCGAKVLVKESLARSGSIAVAPMADEVKVETEKAAAQVRAIPQAATLSNAFDVAMNQEVDDMPTCIGPTPANEDDAGIEWYTAIDGAQSGPFAYAEIVRQIRALELHGRHYVWHDGFGPWKRVRETEDLSAFLPPDEQRKKSAPPPPPPADESPTAQTGAKVVDFATERERRIGGTAPSDRVPSEAATATGVEALRRATDREEQLDKVLNEALGIAGEDTTAQATPEAAAAANALSTPVSIEAAFTVGESGDIDPEALFASVPRADEKDLVARESTRFFVKAAGVNANKSRKRAGMLAGAVAAMMLLAFVGLAAAGVININIPGIGNPFRVANTSGKRSAPAPAGDVSDAERERILAELSPKKATSRVIDNVPRPVRRVRRPARSGDEAGGYVTDDPESGGPTGTRGADVEAEKFEFAAGTRDLAKPQIAPTVPAAAPTLERPDGQRLDQEVIRSVVNARKSSVQICYQREMKRNANLSGKMEFLVTVQPTGIVSKSEVETAKFRGTALAECIREKIEGWRFPAFDGNEQKIVVPFVLQRNSY